MQNPQRLGVTSIQIDAILITLFAQMQGINIAVVHGTGVWATDENTFHTVVLIYLGNGEFMPTRKCKAKMINFLFLVKVVNVCLKSLNTK